MPPEQGKTKSPASRHGLRVGLQIKTALILTFVVTAVVAVGGWSYYHAVHDMMRQKDYDHAVQLGKAFGVAAAADLRDGNDRSLRQLTRDWVKENVVYVAIVDHRSEVAACYGQLRTWHGQIDTKPDSLYHRFHGPNHILIARPIVARNKVWMDERLAGGIRAVLSTHQTTRALAEAKRTIILTAVGIELLALPVGYLLIWRVVLRPFRRLTRVTRKLADGDYNARANMKHRDEAGELGDAFDHMAGQVASMRFQLLRQQDQLEHTVEARTKELKEINDRLCDEMRDKEEFLRAVSHDLNAPMRNIAGMATMIMMNHRDDLPEEVLSRLQRIQSNVDQQSALIDELLEISRIRSRPETPRETDFGKLLYSLVDVFEYELQKRNITLSIDEPMPTLWVDQRRLRQAFQNLIDNAVKYMHRKDGGRIEIRYRFDGLKHEFVVWDNGPGIAPEQREKIFTVFRRGYHTDGAKVEGKGVGLTVVRTIASTYHGRAWVESSPETGTSFHITLADDRVRDPEEEAAYVG
ncbi:MAG: HAMP domain-containing histidine kinase [Phycisphaerae bacterium]|nr:HAMP domain-containing histidine kinase [Phycisphaerae bacterium]